MADANAFTPRFLAAALVAAMINAGLFLFAPRPSVDPLSLPNQFSWEWWRTKAYCGESPPPDVVLLGSSLVMIPLSLADANFLNKTIDATQHPHAVALEEQLARQVGLTGISCFNFALPGGMISDDYMIARSLFHGCRKPKVIVAGITLRDFIDNGVECAAATPTFQYFKHFHGVEDVANLACLTWLEKLKHWQGKLTYLWDNRLELQTTAAQAALSYVNDRLGPGLSSADTRWIAYSKFACTAGSTNQDLSSAAQVAEGMFLLPANQEYPFQDNSREYRKRFKTPRNDLFENQAAFLDRLLELAEQQSIRVLVVNMPVTEQNMRLMPPNSYQKYRMTVTHICKKYSTPILDLNDHRRFAAHDFKDTVHMNASGGEKFARAIASAIASNYTIAAALQKRSPLAARTRAPVQ